MLIGHEYKVCIIGHEYKVCIIGYEQKVCIIGNEQNVCIIGQEYKVCIIGHAQKVCIIGQEYMACIIGHEQKVCIIGYEYNVCIIGISNSDIRQFATLFWQDMKRPEVYFMNRFIKLKHCLICQCILSWCFRMTCFHGYTVEHFSPHRTIVICKTSYHFQTSINFSVGIPVTKCQTNPLSLTCDY